MNKLAILLTLALALVLVALPAGSVSAENENSGLVNGGVTGGGSIIETSNAANITFGGNIRFDSNGAVAGQWQVNFHNVNNDTIDEGHFHSTSFSNLKISYDNKFSNWGAQFTATGRFNGEEGWSMNVRLADFGNPGTGNDSIRIILCNPDNPYNPNTIGSLKYAVYDTWNQKGWWSWPPPTDSQYGWKGDFPDEEAPFWPSQGWTRSVRTKLDDGNLKIHPPALP